MGNIILNTKLVGSIDGDFYVKSYQRGYRWGKEEVIRLLDDIYSNGNKNYCLQPIVVKKEDNMYELIDGQQRLTTLFLIYQVMNIKSYGFLPKPRFSIEYETRKKSKDFLNNIDLSRKEENIDFFHIAQAYETIYSWFADKEKSVMTKINEYLDDKVKIIWYEVDETVDSIELFTRLNIGKIPLTSAEIVKAMFLSRDINEKMTKEKQEEISLQWDIIEKELHNDELWYFLTNSSINEYQTRIDLILDLLSKRPVNCKEKYYTFFEIDKMRQNKDLQSIWADIQHTFLILKDWFENHELYHKIGYLITANVIGLNAMFEESRNKNKDEFIIYLDSLIKKSILIKKNYGELEYDRDYKDIFRLLLLFNIESVRQNGEKTQWFPFDKFKNIKNGKVVWSLEHIHAQQSDTMKTIEAWQEWVKLHLNSIKTVAPDNQELISKMEYMISNSQFVNEEFRKIQASVIEILSEKGNASFINSIGNLALLNSSDNAALSNSTFDVKRNKIIDMDKCGNYIPFCTRMVFFKYYSESEANNLHFWSRNDMKSYIDAINTKLKDYLSEKIIIGDEVND